MQGILSNNDQIDKMHLPDESSFSTRLKPEMDKKQRRETIRKLVFEKCGSFKRDFDFALSKIGSSNEEVRKIVLEPIKEFLAAIRGWYQLFYTGFLPNEKKHLGLEYMEACTALIITYYNVREYFDSNLSHSELRDEVLNVFEEAFKVLNIGINELEGEYQNQKAKISTASLN